MGSYVWRGSLNDAHVPKDCYVSVGGGARSGKDVWYNVHASGSAHDQTKLICEEVGLDFTVSMIGSEDCPTGSEPELDEDKCQSAAAQLHYHWKDTILAASVPKGCYVSVGGGAQTGKDLWFNKHENGRSHAQTRRVCKATR